jgi:hypothetical protein
MLWRPPERTRHQPSDGAWPSAAEAARSRLFSGIHMGSVALCTNYCEAPDQCQRQDTCELCDRRGLDEPGLPLSSDGKRRLTSPAWSG